jgi:hypothetical protein
LTVFFSIIFFVFTFRSSPFAPVIIFTFVSVFLLILIFLFQGTSASIFITIFDAAITVVLSYVIDFVFVPVFVSKAIPHFSVFTFPFQNLFAVSSRPICL